MANRSGARHFLAVALEGLGGWVATPMLINTAPVRSLGLVIFAILRSLRESQNPSRKKRGLGGGGGGEKCGWGAGGGREKVVPRRAVVALKDSETKVTHAPLCIKMMAIKGDADVPPPGGPGVGHHLNPHPVALLVDLATVLCQESTWRESRACGGATVGRWHRVGRGRVGGSAEGEGEGIRLRAIRYRWRGGRWRRLRLRTMRWWWGSHKLGKGG